VKRALVAAGLVVLALVVLAAGANAEPAKPGAWQRTFAAKRAPKNVFFRATYEEPSGRSHELRAWRDGGERLRRDTDGKMSLYVRRGAAGELAFDLVDRVQNMKVQVSRTNLYRVGVFADWSALATNLSEPRGARYELAATDKVETRKAGGECRWITLRAAESQEICWSEAWGVPLAIRQAGRETFRVEEISSKVDASVFTLPEGLFVVDANEDMGGD